MIEFRDINWENYEEVIDLQVNEHEKKFVASNLESLADAFVDWTITGVRPMAYAIYHDDKLVGFIMMSYCQENKDRQSNEDKRYFLWRFMMDKAHQGKGYGRAAMVKMVEHLRTRPQGPAGWCYTSYEPGNDVASGLYAKFGFEETGEIDGGEIVMRMKL